MTTGIRSARWADLPVLREIEVAAAAFADIGMPEIAAGTPPSIDELAGYLRAGRAWVSADADDRPAAYVIALIDHLERWAARRGLPALTLTTFADVAWNGPYYERLGFRRLAEGELPPGLRAVCAAESARGLDRWPRVCMRRPIRPAIEDRAPSDPGAPGRDEG